MTNNTHPLTIASRLFSMFLGISVSSLAFGRAVFAVIIGLALITLFFSRPWRDITRDLLAQCQVPVGILVLLTFVAWLPNVFISNFPLRSFEAVSRTLLLVGIASAFCSYLSTDRRLIDISLRAFTVMTAVSVTFTLLAMTVLPEIFWALRLKGWMSQPIGTHLKGFSNLVVLILPVLILTGYRLPGVWTILSAIASVALLAVVWENYNRSAIAGFFAIAVSVPLAIVVRGGTKRNLLVVLAGIGVAATGLNVWLWATRGQEGMHAVQIALEAESLFPVWLIDFERQTIWSRALEFASVSPWFGIGANTINFLPGADAIIPRTHTLQFIPAHPHNWAVEIFAEVGAVGLAVLLITIIVLAWQAVLNWRSTGNPALILAIAVMAGYWGSGLFNFSYWSAWWQLSFFLSLGLCLTSARGT